MLLMRDLGYCRVRGGGGVMLSLILTPIFEICAVRCGSKSKHKKYVYLEEIGLGVENL